MSNPHRNNRILINFRKAWGLVGGKRSELAELVASAYGVRPPKGKDPQIQFLLRMTSLPAPTRREVVGRLPEWLRAKAPSSRPKSVPFAVSDAFLQSFEWRQLRMIVLKKRGPKCECCGATPQDGVRINVDHIKPRRHFPELALVESNLQVLCADCNHGKGSWDQTDWRVAEPGESSKDSPVPGTATATSMNSAESRAVFANSLTPRLVRKR